MDSDRSHFVSVARPRWSFTDEMVEELLEVLRDTKSNMEVIIAIKFTISEFVPLSCNRASISSHSHVNSCRNFVPVQVRTGLRSSQSHVLIPPKIYLDDDQLQEECTDTE